MRAAALLCQLHLNRLSFPAKIKRHVVDEGRWPADALGNIVEVKAG